MSKSTAAQQLGWPDQSPIKRVRHTPRRRLLSVRSVAHLTSAMIQVTFEGEELADFLSASPDDHVKLAFVTCDGGVKRRDFTPRRFDREAQTLAIDFALHDSGVATRWAMQAKPGDRLEIGGPRGSAVVSSTVKRWLLVGDETALPAIGRRIEELDADARVTSIVAVTGPAEEQCFETAASLTAIWVHRSLRSATDPTAFLGALGPIDLPSDSFVWIAAEASVARGVRSYVMAERGHPSGWIKAAGYWAEGKTEVHEKALDQPLFKDQSW